MTSPILSSSALNNLLNDPKLVLLDCSITKVTGGGSSHESQTIPGAMVVNLKQDFSDTSGRFPNTVPTPDQFKSTCERLGISNDSKVVVFDNIGVYSAPRLWWLFKVMGHDQVQVLNGGVPAWSEAGYATIDRATIPEDTTLPKTTSYDTNYRADHVILHEDILTNVDTCHFTIIDARSNGRFDGSTPEPREGLRSGSIPNSKNLPYQAVLDGHCLKSKEELTQVFGGFSTEKEIIYSCGSGLTACIILLAGQIVGKKSMRVYDGSWTEWATLHP
jgi:thiosulfate/3-mercaptopyruvate sulfurtransferase